MSDKFKVGAILENPLRQFAKIIAIKNGVYALSGWTSREHAEKATVAYTRVNSYGLMYANVKVVSAGKGKSEPSDDAGSSNADNKPAETTKPEAGAPTKGKGKGGAKKAAGKTSAKKTAKGKK